MRRPSAIVAVLVPWLCGFGLFESRNADVERGNAALKAGKADEALGHYDKAVAKLPADPGAHFDRGAALYTLSRFDEAGQEFLRATQSSDTTLKANAFLNLGNAFFRKDKFDEAIEAYKRSLALRPGDQTAKRNLELALVKRKEEEKKKQDGKDKDKKQDDKKQDKDKKQDDKKQDKDEGKDPEKNKQPDPRQGEQPPAPKEAEEKQQIEAVLDNLERSSKDLEKERARLRAVRRRPPTKDW